MTDDLKARGVRVKALTFKDGKHYGATGRTLFAVGIFGMVEVTTGWENGKASAHRTYAETKWFATENDAIAFLQADNKVRILAALEISDE